MALAEPTSSTADATTDSIGGLDMIHYYGDHYVATDIGVSAFIRWTSDNIHVHDIVGFT